MGQDESVLITGAGSFIGHDLKGYLVDKGYLVCGVDAEYKPSPTADLRVLDRRRWEHCLEDFLPLQAL